MHIIPAIILLCNSIKGITAVLIILRHARAVPAGVHHAALPLHADLRARLRRRTNIHQPNHLLVCRGTGDTGLHIHWGRLIYRDVQ